jgi:hypothetical protein
MGQFRSARAKSRPIRSSPTCPHWDKPSQISSSHGDQFVPIPRGNHVSIILRPPLHQHIPRHSQAKSARDLIQPNLTQIRSDWTRLDQTGRNQSVLATNATHSAQQQQQQRRRQRYLHLKRPRSMCMCAKEAKKRPSHSGPSPHAMQCKTRRICTRLVRISVLLVTGKICNAQ